MRKAIPRTKIGRVIVQRCNELGITMSQLEKEIGMAHGMLTAYSKGHIVPSKRAVIRIERKLCLKEGTIEFLLDRPEYDEEDVGHKPSKREKKILEAWKCGDRTPKEVSDITGYSMKIVGMYLPLEEEYI